MGVVEGKGVAAEVCTKGRRREHLAESTFPWIENNTSKATGLVPEVVVESTSGGMKVKKFSEAGSVMDKIRIALILQV